MNRRTLLQLASAGAVAGAMTRREAVAQEQVARATRGMPSPKIKDISVIACAPAGSRLVVVKITTDQDGLYGYGCGTFTQRADLVVPAVERYLKPFLLGKVTDRIDDTWQAMYNSSYWRNGPVLNNAISGVDMALWDIKGRQAGMPVYQLLGGKCREAADCYGHASGGDNAQVIESVKSYLARGFRHVRVQIGSPGMAAYGSGGGAQAAKVAALHSGPVYEPAAPVQHRSGVTAIDATDPADASAGVDCSGQVLVLHDMLDVYPGKKAKFVRNFLDGATSIQQAVENYVQAVKDGSFPGPEHSF